MMKRIKRAVTIILLGWLLGAKKVLGQSGSGGITVLAGAIEPTLDSKLWIRVVSLGVLLLSSIVGLGGLAQWLIKRYRHKSYSKLFKFSLMVIWSLAFVSLIFWIYLNNS